MPQTENLMLGLERVPSTTRMEKFQLENADVHKPKSALMTSEQENPVQDPKTRDIKRKISIVHFKDSKNVVIQVGSGNEEEKEKNTEFSIRWELQLTALVIGEINVSTIRENIHKYNLKISFFIAVVLPISMVVIGGVYLYNCPRNIMIPIFLIVCGCTFMMSTYGLWKLSGRRRTPFDILCYKNVLWMSILFLAGWFIAGCYWVYEAYEPNYENIDDNSYCNQTVYQFAFWLLNSVFVVLAVALILVVSFIACSCQLTSSSIETNV